MTPSDQTAEPGDSHPAGIHNVLVIHKKSYFQQVVAKKDQHVLNLIRRCDPSVSAVLPAHIEHISTLSGVRQILRERGIHCLVIPREKIAEALASQKWDLVVTIGGDGTIIDVSHFLGSDIPVLGINSTPSTSYGHFCLGKLDTFNGILDEIACGRRQPMSLMRLQPTLDGTKLSPLVFNEAFFGDAKLAVASRYRVKLGKQETIQRSDGLLIGSPAGSTGWMRSYQCRILPIGCRKFQFLARGTIIQKASDLMLRRALMDSKEELTLVSMMEDGVLLLDSHFNRFPLKRGSVVTIRPAEADLKLFIEPGVNDKYKRRDWLKHPPVSLLMTQDEMP